jgi:guanylate kinase
MFGNEWFACRQIGVLVNNCHLNIKVVFGSGGVGKSSITLRFVTDTFNSEYLPTVCTTSYHTYIHNTIQYHYALPSSFVVTTPYLYVCMCYYVMN